MIARRTPRQHGSSMVSTLVGACLLLVTVLALARTTVGGLALERSNGETTLALRAAEDALENARTAGLASAFSLYNSDSSDDPGGAGSAPGSTFTVSGLRARTGSATAIGRYVFPVFSGAPGVLDETAPSPFHGAAADLDMDGAATSRDVTATCAILPVAVEIEWQGASGPRTLRIATVIGR